ncbi:MAG: hypothetical protein H6512_09125 [Acidimicrobiia bacterium]|nr:hypothetical protein [Acidimicrobiia bacterium]
MPERSHDELYAIADALIADAQDGEQVEVYVGSVSIPTSTSSTPHCTR